MPVSCSFTVHSPQLVSPASCCLMPLLCSIGTGCATKFRGTKWKRRTVQGEVRAAATSQVREHSIQATVAHRRGRAWRSRWPGTFSYINVILLRKYLHYCLNTRWSRTSRRLHCMTHDGASRYPRTSTSILTASTAARWWRRHCQTTTLPRPGPNWKMQRPLASEPNRRAARQVTRTRLQLHRMWRRRHIHHQRHHCHLD